MLPVTQLSILLSILLGSQIAFGSPQSPAESPPWEQGSPPILSPKMLSDDHKMPLALSEWTFHKSADGSRPSGVEQQYMWMMNRARANPEVEGIWLSLVQDSLIQNAISYFSVNKDILRTEFGALSPTPPAAFDIRLHNAAVAHSEYLISVDGQNHNDQFQRMSDAGFSYSSGRGSVFSYSRNGAYGHAGFNIDWGGDDGTGMQTGRGHRAGLMGNYSNVGVGVVEENNVNTSVGPEVTTINYCNARTSSANHYNRFIVGTVWEDQNGNYFYDPGEGLSGVTVMLDSGDFFAVTGTAGGYAIPVDSGTYQISYSGGALSQPVDKNVTVGSSSLLVPWVDVPSVVLLAGTSIDIDAVLQEADTSWSFAYGLPSTVSVSSDLENWEIIDDGISKSGSTLNWSENWSGSPTPRFWRIQAWNYLED
ncbi:hypothetical protein [Cerasicoccus arenae]|nr:hypothetical protein [Cerasicoccus arenae]MBK1858380.1 hypothetical protein [Cerasicoccus arenae]